MVIQHDNQRSSTTKEAMDHHFDHVLSSEAFQKKHHEMLVKRHLKWMHKPIVKTKNHSFRNIAVAMIMIIFSIYAAYELGSSGNMPDEELSLTYTSKFHQENTDIIYTEGSLSITEIANLLEPSIVSITNEIIEESFFGETVGTSSGSGIVFDITTEGIYMMTNNHVIDNSSTLNVNFSGSKIYPAVIIGSDEDTDLAVVFVSQKDLEKSDLQKIRPVTLGNSDLIDVGEIAIAIGNPLGYNNTVTLGIISAVDRIISEDLNALSLIQTDAAINPGNSGGALVNGNGELIGINTIKISDTAVEGIGFAIPINSAIPILKELMEKGYVSKPFIGIYGRDVTEELAQIYDIPIGVFVSDIVKRGPAASSKLEIYDIITAINGETIKTMMDLNRVINQYKIGDIITLTVLREMKEEFKAYEIKITIGDKHDY
ncbi:MAG: trypsin-like peptidase domain-containing protein [Clostridia bacterium]|nr:trypsin-like peptidase domain-containing protein [Clostridia bacterium]